MAHQIILVVTFSKDGTTLTEYRATVDSSEEFRKENPDILLFDGVAALYDTV